MRRQMWWQNARMTVLVAGLVLLAAYILVGAVGPSLLWWVR